MTELAGILDVAPSDDVRAASQRVGVPRFRVTADRKILSATQPRARPADIGGWRGAVCSRDVPPVQLSHFYRAAEQRLGREVALELLPREVEGLVSAGLGTGRSCCLEDQRALARAYVIADAGGPHLRCPERIAISAVDDRGAGLRESGR